MADTVPNGARAGRATADTVGPYTLIRRLGRGGMGEAFLAEKTGPGGFRLKVCLKLILPAKAEDAAFVASFLDEAAIHAQLRHPNIVTVVDFGRESTPDGRYYLALEYIEGCDLRALMHALEDAGLRLPVHLAVLIAYEVARALDCAHQLRIDGVPQNLVHRDLSPANILVSLSGQAKLSDFGIVKAENRVTNTASGIAKGKVPYMAPEQLYAHDVDARADLFALGVVLYELFAGSHPFRLRHDDPEMLVATRISKGERMPIRRAAPHVPDELCAMVDRLLEPEAARRVPSARVLMELLAPHVPGTVSASEIHAYVESVRSNGAFPSSAIPASSPSARNRVDGSTITRSEILPKTEASAAAAEPRSTTLNAKRLVGWTPWLAIAGIALVALVLIAPSALKGPRQQPRTTQPPAQLAPPADGIGGNAHVPTHAATAASPAPMPSASSRAAEPTAEGLAAAKPTDERPASLGDHAVDSRHPNSSMKPRPAATGPSESNSKGPAKRRVATNPPSETASETGPATLRVVVLPYGSVEVNGHQGRAPLSVQLAPGTHEIKAGRNGLGHRETVTVQSGEHKEVVVELAEGE